MKITKQQFDNEFKMEDLQIIAVTYEADGIPDKPARRECYNNKVDLFLKNGLITEKKANNWCIPPHLETTLYWL